MYEIQWFKVESNIFSNRKIQIILNLPDGDTYFRIWIHLIALAVECNNNGRLEIAGTVTNSADVTQKEVDVTGTLTNNETITSTTVVNSGTITNSGTVTATNITNNENATITNKGTIESEEAIVNAGTITSNAEKIVTGEIKNNGGTYIVTGGTVSYKITGENGKIDVKNDEVTIANDIENNTINLEKTLIVKEESYLKDSSTLSIGGTDSVLDIENGTIGTIDAEVAITAANWDLKLDIDLQAATADMLNNVAINNSLVEISALNILTDKANNDKIQIANTNIVNNGVYEVIYQFSSEKMNLPHDNILLHRLFTIIYGRRKQPC